MTDLVEHIGQTQHWVAEIMERRITDPTQLPTQMAPLPTDPRQWLAWLSESLLNEAVVHGYDAANAAADRPADIDRHDTGTRYRHREATHGAGTSSPANVQLDRANRRIRR